MHRTQVIAVVAGFTLVVGISGMGAAAAAESPRCQGQRATIVGEGKVVGTAHRDVIVLTGAATVKAGNGNDLICGSKGNDVINAGAGNDVVFAGAGNDRVSGGAGNDTLNGDTGNDAIAGGAGDDII